MIAVPSALVARPIGGAVLGAGAALIIGLIAIALAPNHGFADLAAAAATRVALIPLGAVVGGVVAYRVGH